MKREVEKILWKVTLCWSIVRLDGWKKQRWILSDNINPCFKEILTRTFSKGYSLYLSMSTGTQIMKMFINQKIEFLTYAYLFIYQICWKIDKGFYMRFNQMCWKFVRCWQTSDHKKKKHFVDTKETFVFIFSSKTETDDVELFTDSRNLCEKIEKLLVCFINFCKINSQEL